MSAIPIVSRWNGKSVIGCILVAAFAAACGSDPTPSTDAGTVTPDAGTAAECNSPSDCPDPGNECLSRICLAHQCGTVFVAYGTPTENQSDGDCTESVCDGKGGKTSVAAGPCMA